MRSCSTRSATPSSGATARAISAQPGCIAGPSRPGSLCASNLDEHIAEFPRIDDRRTGLQHRYGYAIHHTEPLSGAILRYDLMTGTTARIAVGEGRVPSEAVFVPARNDASEREGYLIAYRSEERR